MKSFILAAIVAAISTLSAAAAGLMAMEPFAYETAPSAKAGGAYISIMSHGGGDRLLDAKSPVAKRVEIHTHIKDGDVMRMRRVDGPIPVTADAPIKMAPGGVHIMLMGLNHALDAGTTIPVTLVFETAGELTVDVPVIKRGAQTGPSGHSGHSVHSSTGD